MQNNRHVGSEYEEIAADFLKDKGYDILERNYRCPVGEIDIIASRSGTIIFVEVKYRVNKSKGYPAEAVSVSKQKVISRVAEYYLTAIIHKTDVSCRFDVISILDGNIEHIENAFDYAG